MTRLSRPIALAYEIVKRREKLLMWVAWHLPRELVKWCFIRVAAHATTGRHRDTTMPELLVVDALKRWDP